jgi:catechol 2,3-dioxygenase-like lactoylglutathione lyase family enzyme
MPSPARVRTLIDRRQGGTAIAPAASPSDLHTASTFTASAVKPRITVITLGVDDLTRSLEFYRDGLGLSTEGIIGREHGEHAAVVFIELEGGLRLALWPRESIARDTGLHRAAPAPTELTIGHNVSGPAEVDEVMEQARAAGATIVAEPHDTFFGGYAGYFQDPDGHLWEIVWNPAFEF